MADDPVKLTYCFLDVVVICGVYLLLFPPPLLGSFCRKLNVHTHFLTTKKKKQYIKNLGYVWMTTNPFPNISTPMNNIKHAIWKSCFREDFSKKRCCQWSMLFILLLFIILNSFFFSPYFFLLFRFSTTNNFFATHTHTHKKRNLRRFQHHWISTGQCWCSFPTSDLYRIVPCGYRSNHAFCFCFCFFFGAIISFMIFFVFYSPVKKKK